MRYRMDYTLFKRRMPSGRIVYYYAVYDEDGRRVYRSTGQRTKALADKYVRDLAEHGRLGTIDRSRVRLRDYARDFYVPGLCPIEKFNHSRGRSMTKATMSIRRTALVEHILPHLGDIPVYNITASRIDRWLMELPEKDHVSRSTANSYLDALRGVMGQAVRDGIIAANPTAGIERLGSDTRITKAFTVDEVNAIIGKESDWKNPIIRNMCILAALTGMRIGEVRALRWSCISRDTVMVRSSFSNIDGLKCPKNGRERLAPISEKVYEAVTRYALRYGDDSYVFRLSRDEDRPISAGYINRCLSLRMEELGIKGKSFHSFRAFFNTQLVSANVDGEAIRAIMGHATEGMTLRYLDTNAAEFPAFRKVQDEICGMFLTNGEAMIS